MRTKEQLADDISKRTEELRNLAKQFVQLGYAEKISIRCQMETVDLSTFPAELGITSCSPRGFSSIAYEEE